MSAKHTATQEAGQAKSNEKWEIDQIDAFNAWSLRQKNIDPFSAMFAWMASARHQAAQAAPAASDITPWEERKHVGGSVRNSAACMFEEINELRAALAARAAPAVQDGWKEQVFELCNFLLSQGWKLTPAMERCMLEATGNMNKYPNPIDALARMALAVAPSAPSVSDAHVRLANAEQELKQLHEEADLLGKNLDALIAAYPSASAQEKQQ